MPKIVFACVHNAGRSQIAAAWFNHFASTRPNSRRDSPLRGVPAREDAEPVIAISAGTSPADHVHPEVVEVMKELGIDLSSAVPQKLTDLLKDAQLLVTLGCGDRCPYVPGLKTEDWPLEDPEGKTVERVRAIRDEICRRVEDLIRRIRAE